MYKGKCMRQEAASAKKRNYRPLALILALVLLVGSVSAILVHRKLWA